MLTPVLDWLNTAAFTAFGAPTTWAEVLGFSTGALCVWLVTRQHVTSWPIGIANNLLWILLFATAGLYADSGLQVAYIVLACYGWWQWVAGGPDRSTLPVSATTGRQWVAIAAAGLAGTGALTWLLATHTPSTVPLADAVTTVLSLLATWGQCRKKVESWWLWMTADVIYVPLYHHKGLDLTALLYIGFFALCVKGYLAWRADLTHRRDSTPTAAGPELVGAGR